MQSLELTVTAATMQQMFSRHKTRTVGVFKEMYSDYGSYKEVDNGVIYIVDSMVLHMSYEDDDSMFIFTFDIDLWPDYLDVSELV